MSRKDHRLKGDANSIWNRVCNTDPKYTKLVTIGSRKFTATDAYYQVKTATELFGPVGDGWGWHVRESTIADGLYVVTITLWYHTPPPPEETGQVVLDNKVHQFDVVGCCNTHSKAGAIDKDCAKKALTDAITKALSFLGFQADVFFGRFDDNKYVQHREQEVAKQEETTDPEWFAEKIGGDGKNSDKTWRYLTEGPHDGGRHGWLDWALGKWKDETRLKRVRWILKRFYDDDRS